MTSDAEIARSGGRPPAGREPFEEAPTGRPWVARDDVGADGLRRWERDDLARFANTGEPAFLDAVLEEGSAVARARARRLIEARPRPAVPPLPGPDPGFRERASRIVAGLRRRRAAERAAAGGEGSQPRS